MFFPQHSQNANIRVKLQTSWRKAGRLIFSALTSCFHASFCSEKPRPQTSRSSVKKEVNDATSITGVMGSPLLFGITLLQFFILFLFQNRVGTARSARQSENKWSSARPRSERTWKKRLSGKKEKKGERENSSGFCCAVVPRRLWRGPRQQLLAVFQLARRCRVSLASVVCASHLVSVSREESNRATYCTRALFIVRLFSAFRETLHSSSLPSTSTVNIRFDRVL